MSVPPVSTDAAPGAGTRSWSRFVRLELLEPIDALAGLGVLLAQDAGDTRPGEYLADVHKLLQAADRLARLACELLTVGEEATSADLEQSLSNARHDLINRLNQLAGMVQLLQIAEADHFGAFSADLARMLDLCRECEARLLRQSGRGGWGAGLSAAEIAHVVEQIRDSHSDDPCAEAERGSVLIADDDPLNREVLRRLLSQEGHQVEEAASGAEVLELLGRRRFDVLLLDILMPGMNGFEVLRRLGECDGPSRPSVIVVSALDGVDGLVSCLEKGADDYLTKPVNKALVRARINSCLQKRRRRARELGQFFPPEVLTHLLDNPQVLGSRSAEVTILFCDVRGFSRISERLKDAPERKMEWLSAVLESLDECVVRHEGVLIDFIGDELMALWGAPCEQPDHARRACDAALDMLACVEELSERWQPVVGEATQVGIGINSGPATVGNVGTKRRFKYGATGNTVNLASRIQGATKYLRTNVLLTESTRRELGEGYCLRRLARLQVVNIKEPVTVHELAPQGAQGWAQMKEGYESALGLYESGPEHLQAAARSLGRLTTSFGLSGPNIFLLSRILGAMQDSSAWSGVHVLPGK